MAQIIETARGSLVGRLRSLPLAFGEMFIHTEADVEGTGPQGVIEIAPNVPLRDLTTNTDIRRIFKGDLYAGYNSNHEVFSLGSGNALKWGGLFAATGLAAGTTYWDAIKEQAKKLPNHLFMFVGPTPDRGTNDQLKGGTKEWDNTTRLTGNQKVEGTSPETDGIINEKYEAKRTQEYDDPINIGDLFFYSPVKDDIIVLHLNHSTDALLKIVTSNITSESMRADLKAFATATDGENQPEETYVSTLKTLLNGPVRYFHTLIKDYGWQAVDHAVTDVVNGDATVGTQRLNLDTNNDNVLSYPNDGDGRIHFIPYVNGRQGEMSVKLDTSDTTATTLREGDLIITLPKANDAAGTRHVKVSIFGDMIKNLDPSLVKITRADDYADALWKTHDTNLENTADSLADYINDLYNSKVDLDPVTKKVVSSQLPDYLLGAVKYQGNFYKSDYNGWNNNPTALGLANALLNKNHDSPADIGSSGDTDSNHGTTSDIGDNPSVDNNSSNGPTNETLKVGCYWIYQGISTNAADSEYTQQFNISNYGSVFNLQDHPEEHAEGDDWENGTLIHALNKGDWIVWNGTKFDIIDNSSTFLGLTHNESGDATVASSLVDLQENKRNGTLAHLEGQNSSTSIPATSEVDVELSQEAIKFGNYNGVMFNEDQVSENHLPLITSQGWAYNSRFEVTDEANGNNDVFYQLGLAMKLKGGSDERYADHTVDLTWADIANRDIQNYVRDGIGGTDSSFALKNDGGNQRTWWEAIDQELMTEGGVAWLSFSRDHKTRDTSVKAVSGGCEGFDYGNVEWYTDWQGTNGGYYSYKIAKENQVKLYLPSHSGTLATEKYVNLGFEVTKQLITDGVEYLKQLTTSGHEQWLQTVVKSGDTKVIHDSYVKAVGSGVGPNETLADASNAKLVLELNTRKKPYANDDSASHVNLITTELLKEENRHDSDTSPANAQLGMPYIDVNHPADGQDGFDYHIGTEGAGAKTLNPSTRSATTVVENFLPNHSGVLINNNSVIDCGYWPAPSN